MANLTELINDLVVGDDYDIIRNIDAIPVSQSMTDAWFTVKENSWDSSAIIVKHITTISSADGWINDSGAGDTVGAIRFSLTADETSVLHEFFQYAYDIQVQTNLGKIYTPEKGTLIPQVQVTTPAMSVPIIPVGALTDGIFFGGSGNNWVQDTPHFSYNATQQRLKLTNTTADTPVLPTATNYFLLHKNTTSTNPYYIGISEYQYLTQNVDNVAIVGQYSYIEISGTYTNGNITGHYTAISNRLSPNIPTNTQMIAFDANCSIDAPVAVATGALLGAGTGGSGGGATPLIIGVDGIASTHNTHNARLIGGRLEIRNGAAFAGSADLGQAVHALILNLSDVLTEAQGLAVTDWSVLSGNINKTKAIYIDNTHNVGTDENYCIYSDSTALSVLSGGLKFTNAITSGFVINSLSTRPSQFQGAVGVPNFTFSDSWEDDSSVPTRNDIYGWVRNNKYQSASLDYRKRIIHFHDGEDATGLPNGGFNVGQNQAGIFNLTTPTWANFPDAIGVLILRLGTSATNAASISEKSVVNGGSKSEFGVFGRGAVKAKYRIGFLVLSDAVNTYQTWVGLSNGFIGTAPTCGAFFRYTHSVNGGKWQAVCLTGGVETAVDTGIAPVADSSLHTFRVETDSAANSVTFYIDDVFITSIDTNIPTSTDFLGACWQVIRSVGTTDVDIMAYDYARSEWVLNSPRQ